MIMGHEVIGWVGELLGDVNPATMTEETARQFLAVNYPEFIKPKYDGAYCRQLLKTDPKLLYNFNVTKMYRTAKFLSECIKFTLDTALRTNTIRNLTEQECAAISRMARETEVLLANQRWDTVFSVRSALTDSHRIAVHNSNTLYSKLEMLVMMIGENRAREVDIAQRLNLPLDVPTLSTANESSYLAVRSLLVNIVNTVVPEFKESDPITICAEMARLVSMCLKATIRISELPLSHPTIYGKRNTDDDNDVHDTAALVTAAYFKRMNSMDKLGYPLEAIDLLVADDAYVPAIGDSSHRYDEAIRYYDTITFIPDMNDKYRYADLNYIHLLLLMRKLTNNEEHGSAQEN